MHWLAVEVARRVRKGDSFADIQASVYTQLQGALRAVIDGGNPVQTATDIRELLAGLDEARALLKEEADKLYA